MDSLKKYVAKYFEVIKKGRKAKKRDDDNQIGRGEMQQADDNKKSETKDVKKLFYRRSHVEIWGQEFSFAAMRRPRRNSAGQKKWMIGT